MRSPCLLDSSQTFPGKGPKWPQRWLRWTRRTEWCCDTHTLPAAFADYRMDWQRKYLSQISPTRCRSHFLCWSSQILQYRPHLGCHSLSGGHRHCNINEINEWKHNKNVRNILVVHERIFSLRLLLLRCHSWRSFSGRGGLQFLLERIESIIFPRKIIKLNYSWLHTVKVEIIHLLKNLLCICSPIWAVRL